MIGAPSAARIFAAVLLPDPIPPVSPIVIAFIAFRLRAGPSPAHRSSRRLASAPRLEIVEVAEEAAAREQFGERALFGDLAVAQDQNKIGILDGREAVRD